MTSGEWEDFEEDVKSLSRSFGSMCGAGKLIGSLSEEGIATIEYALTRDDLTTSAILKAIKKRVNTDVSSYTMRRHRKGDCACTKG